MTPPNTELIRRILGFAGSLGATMVVSVATFPIVISGLGAHKWAGLAVGQSTGALVAILLGWGWAVTGPSRVATMNKGDGVRFWVSSLSARTFLLLPSCVLGIVLVFAIYGHADSSTVIAMLTSGLGGGLLPSWFYAGVGEPAKLFKLVTVPSLVAAVAGAGLAHATHSPVLYALIGLVATLISIGLTTVDISSRGEGVRMLMREVRWRGVLHKLKEQSSGVTIAVVATAFVNMPMLVVSHWYATELPQFAMADRLYRLGRSAISPVTQAYQSTIPDPSPVVTLERGIRSLRTLSVLGVCAAFGFTLGAPFASHILSAGAIRVTLAVAAAYAMALLALVLTSVIGVGCLALVGRAQSVVASVVAGAIIGASLMAVGVCLDLGIEGVAFAVCLAELAVLAWQVTTVLRLSRARYLVLGTSAKSSSK